MDRSALTMLAWVYSTQVIQEIVDNFGGPILQSILEEENVDVLIKSPRTPPTMGELQSYKCQSYAMHPQFVGFPSNGARRFMIACRSGSC